MNMLEKKLNSNKKEIHIDFLNRIFKQFYNVELKILSTRKRKKMKFHFLIFFLFLIFIIY
jgi:hypothetical protein